MQEFRLRVNQLESLLTEKTGLTFDIKQSGKHNSDVDFISKTNEGIDVLLKIRKTDFLNDTPNVKWSYCADPTSDYWVTRNSSDLVSLTTDFHSILKNKMFDPTYLKKLTDNQ